MSVFIADQISKLMTKKDISINGANILMMGLAFKENCPDIRNTKVIDIYNGIKKNALCFSVENKWFSTGFPSNPACVCGNSF